MSLKDIISCVADNQVARANAMLLLDEALWLAGTEKSAGVLFSGPIALDKHMFPTATTSEGASLHYLLRRSGSEVRASGLDPTVSVLYELQGLSAVRCPEIRRSSDTSRDERRGTSIDLNREWRGDGAI